MIKALLATTAMVGMMATAATAADKTAAGVDCSADMKSAYDSHGPILSGNTAVPLESRAVVRDLRSAAIGLKRQGHEGACREVVAVLNDVAKEYMEAQKSAGTEAKPMSREEVEAKVVAVGAQAEVLGTDELVGTNVYNYTGEFLGEVDGVLMRGGKASHMIVGHGGFWNIGDQEAAIPLDRLKMHPDSGAIYVNMTEEQLEKAPDYDKKDGRWVSEKNDQFYDDHKIQ